MEDKTKAWNLTSKECPRWVWPGELQGHVNQYVDFVHEFELGSVPPDAALWISVDTDYAVWLNGGFVARGQYSDFPSQKTFDWFPLAGSLQKGGNRLAITVYYDGQTSSTYLEGAAGLLYQLTGITEKVLSGDDTLFRLNPCYHSGPMARVSGQLSFTFGYDARHDDDFLRAPLTSPWRRVTAHDVALPEDRRVLLPRPVDRLVDQGPTASRLHAQGVFQRDFEQAEATANSRILESNLTGLAMETGELLSVGWLMQHDQLSFRDPTDILVELPETALQEGRFIQIRKGATDGQHGAFLIFDMGKEDVGILELDVRAHAGCILDIGYGEHLDDQRVRTFVGGRSFAARYVCKEGRQQFTHHTLRWAGRYLQVQIHGDSSDFALYHLHLRRQEYPVINRGAFISPDPFHEQVINVSKRTLHLCMHEHYEDTPWREQALYANDSRTQALCGYYAYGESSFPASSFSLLGRGLRSDGLLELTAPAKPSVTIPSFTLVWMLAVRDHVLYTGDTTLAEPFFPQIISMLDRLLDALEDGILPLREAKGLWHFYDWTDSLTGSEIPFAKGKGSADPLLNSYLILAMEAAIQINNWLGGKRDLSRFNDAIAAIRIAVHHRFYDAGQAVYRTFDGEPVISELTQALAVLANVPPSNDRNRVLSNLCRSESGLSVTGISQSFYKYEALMSGARTYGQRVLAEIRNTWGFMLNQGATTFWETIKGASDFSNAGSLCHAWSAVPLFVYYQQILGVRPVAPGFSRFVIDPLPCGIPWCEGVVPTPHGDIRLRWERQNGQLHYNLSCPDACQPVIPGEPIALLN